MRYRHVALIGLGLIASSISHAIRRSGADVRITGTARSAATRTTAARLGLGEIVDTAAEAAAGADLVILCVPVGAMAEVAAEIAPVLAPGATVTDVGSVKGAVVAAVGPHMPEGVHFIPGHPLAGTEHSGPGAGFAALFDNRWCILTPLAEADPQAVADLTAFWSELGARVDTMDPDHHDLVLAVTSHVPHLIAYTMVGVAEHLARVRPERSSLKRPSISSTASLLARNTSRHMVGSDAAMRVKSRNPEAENLMTSARTLSSMSAAVPTML